MPALVIVGAHFKTYLGPPRRTMKII
ncbi:hypothetical protein SVAN01_10264 [Stagonosporopsis vannaccii]|nr:hypothetical protein SVAN01_10264 [Stagonosporopsis vannaccii]